MARKSAAEMNVDQHINDVVTENMNENVVAEAKIEKKKEVIKELPLDNFEEIHVISMVDNVTYKDKHTGDYYEWAKAGHVEYMTVETLNNMWRNYKRYFRSMWLKPLDNRIVKRFGLTSLYEKFDFLMDSKNYTRANIKNITDGLNNLPNDMKRTICDKVKSFIENGDVTDVAVIRAIERYYNIDLISYLD